MIGALLKEERERLGLVQQGVIDKLGISKKTLIEWEKGNTYPNAAHLTQLAELGYDVNYILFGERVTQAGRFSTPNESSALNSQHEPSPDLIEGANRLKSELQRLNLSVEEAAQKAGENSPRMLQRVLDGVVALPQYLLARLTGIGVDPYFVTRGQSLQPGEETAHPVIGSLVVLDQLAIQGCLKFAIAATSSLGLDPEEGALLGARMCRIAMASGETGTKAAIFAVKKFSEGLDERDAYLAQSQALDRAEDTGAGSQH